MRDRREDYYGEGRPTPDFDYDCPTCGETDDIIFIGESPFGDGEHEGFDFEWQCNKCGCSFATPGQAWERLD